MYPSTRRKHEPSFMLIECCKSKQFSLLKFCHLWTLESKAVTGYLRHCFSPFSWSSSSYYYIFETIRYGSNPKLSILHPRLQTRFHSLNSQLFRDCLGARYHSYHFRHVGVWILPNVCKGVWSEKGEGRFRHSTVTEVHARPTAVSCTLADDRF